MEGNPQKELDLLLEHLDKLSNGNQDVLRKNVYNTFSGIAFLFLKAKESYYKRGWVSNLLDRHDDPLFSDKDSKILESALVIIRSPSFHDIQMAVLNSDTKPSSIPHQVALENLDGKFSKVKSFFSQLTGNLTTLSRELGDIRYFNEMNSGFIQQIPLPISIEPFVTTFLIPIPNRRIPIYIRIFIEAIHSIGPLSSAMTRNMILLTMAIIDILEGNWKQGLVGCIIFFRDSPLLAGLLIKVILTMCKYILPNIDERLVMDAYSSPRSLGILLLVWGFICFSSDIDRETARIQFDSMKDLIHSKELNGKIDSVPSFEDISNLQRIAHEPELYSSKEFQNIKEKLLTIPVIYLLIDLMNISDISQKK